MARKAALSLAWHLVRAATGAVLLGGCAGVQSALEPAGQGAARLADLFWVTTAGAVVIWVSVVGLTLHVVYFSRKPLSERGGKLLVIGAGVALPTVVLAVLLVFSLSMLPELLAPAPAGALKVQVTGHQWWWRVRYQRSGDEPVELANEIHLPAGEPVEFQLESSDVIHSFWIPALGGKVDMIPGRRTRLVLRPTKAGVYRGACAEYCGASHALMSFYVVVEGRDQFDRWLAEQARSAVEPATGMAAAGQALFITSGCGACHSVRGSQADGSIGPDLTHVGSRRSLGAGVLANDTAAFQRFIARTHDVKPGVTMPAFDMLPEPDLHALAVYLDGLR